MTTDSEFDRIAAAWLAEGPDELSDRVLDAAADQIHVTRQRRATRAPWRFPTMTSPVRVAVAAVIGVLAVGGAFLILGRPGQPAVGGPGPSHDPYPAASASASAGAGTFTSPRYGYSIDYPAGWTATPATAAWRPDADTLYGDPSLDTIGTTDARLAIASEQLAGTLYQDERLVQGQDATEWLLANCHAPGPTASSCGPRTLIGGQPGWLDEDGSPAEGGTVATGGVIFDAAVVFGDRGYVFTLDGKVDRALFDSLMAGVTFDADNAVDLPPLTKTFTSPSYGYSIGIGEGFTVTPGTSRSSLGASTGTRDEIKLTKDEWFVTAISAPTPPGATLDEWLAAKFPARAGGDGMCARDDPTTWPTIPIGDQTGRLNRNCHSTEAVVVVGGRAYDFFWQYQVTETHHSFGDWKALLASVTFDPASAHDEP